MISKSILLVVGLLLLSVIVFLFYTGVGTLGRDVEWRLIGSLAEFVISLILFLGMIGTVVVVLSKGALDNKS